MHTLYQIQHFKPDYETNQVIAGAEKQVSLCVEMENNRTKSRFSWLEQLTLMTWWFRQQEGWVEEDKNESHIPNVGNK